MVRLPYSEKSLRICITVYVYGVCRTDGQTDRRTDILPRHSSRYAYESRGKNHLELRRQEKNLGRFRMSRSQILTFFGGFKLKSLCKVMSYSVARSDISSPIVSFASLLCIPFVFKGKGKALHTCYSATYMSQTRDQQRFTISEVAADWHEPMVPQRIMWPSIAHANGQLDPRCS